YSTQKNKLMKITITLIIASFVLLIACEKAALYEDLIEEMVIGFSSLNEEEGFRFQDYECGAAPDLAVLSPIVFIAGFEEDDNTYYANATRHFKEQGYLVIEGLSSLDQILNHLDLKQRGNFYSEIHVVSHSNPWRGMSLKTEKDGERLTTKSLQNYIAKKQLPIQYGITNETKIIFHSCGLGENTALLSQLKLVFSEHANPSIIASPYFNIFGGKYASHYLAKPYYVFYPTAQSKGPLALSQEMAANNQSKTINWQEALTAREEPALGEVYSYRFNIPVHWEVEFSNASEIPNLETPDAIMDFVAEDQALAKVLFEMKIPLEKYRWTARVKDNVLKISGKTTALCVLEPLMNLEDVGNYATLNILDKKLYTNL
ncbi:MAG: hypothetical protein ACI86C_000848, partial [Candidatus Latescibacterota bacterium]